MKGRGRSIYLAAFKEDDPFDANMAIAGVHVTCSCKAHGRAPRQPSCGCHAYGYYFSHMPKVTTRSLLEYVYHNNLSFAIVKLMKMQSDRSANAPICRKKKKRGYEQKKKKIYTLSS